MANDGYKIYINDAASPNLGVTITKDTQDVLGASSYSDIGGIITHSNINPFALFKPARSSVKGMIERGSFNTLGFGTSSGSNSLPYATTVNGLVSLYADGNSNYIWGTVRANGWRYLKPRGLSQSEWFRFFDFVKVISENSVLHPVAGVGYDHQAVNPFGAFDCVTNVTKNGGAYTASNTRRIPQSGVPEYDITIEDINAVLNSAYKMLYYGVMLVPVSGQSGVTTAYLIFNNNETINDDNTGDDYIRGNERLYLNSFLLSDTMPVGLYTAYPFLSGTPLNTTTRSLLYLDGQWGNTLPARIYPLPGTTPLQVNIYDTDIILNVVAVGRVDSSYGGQIYITIKNNTTSTVNVPRLEMQFRTSDTDFTTARRTGEVFYDGQNRFDDNYPYGRADSKYASVLRKSGGYDVAGNGGEIKIPAGEGLTMLVDIPSPQTSWLIVGDPTRTRVFGSTEFRMPAIPQSGGQTIVEP